ncbi:MAG: glycosyltransferase [Gilvibacter sp.]
MNKGVSVIICCYNSEKLIEAALEALASQVVDATIDWEVIVVDNNCTDQTVQTAKAFWSSTNNKQTLQVVQEPAPGLSNARLRGIDTAHYEYIIFCDDDNRFGPNYLQRAYALLDSNPLIGAAGGRSEIEADYDIPFWFNSYRANFAVGVQHTHSGFLEERKHVWGAGMVTRKSVIQNLLKSGFTFNCSDRKGTDVTSGGDSEICRWLLLVGYKLWYDEDLFYTHAIPQNRLTKEYFTRLRAGFKTAYYELRMYDLAQEYFNLYYDRPKQLRILRFQSVMSICWFRFFNKSEYAENRFLLQRLFPKTNRFVVHKKYQNIINATRYYLKEFNTLKGVSDSKRVN